MKTSPPSQSLASSSDWHAGGPGHALAGVPQAQMPHATTIPIGVGPGGGGIHVVAPSTYLRRPVALKMAETDADEKPLSAVAVEQQKALVGSSHTCDGVRSRLMSGMCRKPSAHS